MRWFKKDTVDGCKNIDIFWLRKQGLLKSYYNTGINWTNSFGKSSVGVIIEIHPDADSFMQLIYNHTDSDGNQKPLDYKVRLTSTKCNYGGCRWWFICPNISCGKRVAKLYSYGKYFVCRHCAELTYESCQKSGSNFLLGKIIDLQLKFENLRDKTKIFLRKERLTKKAKKLWQMNQKMDYLFSKLKRWMDEKK